MTMVYTVGTFDLLHVGHLALLNQCKALGDVVAVGVASDEVVNIYKPNIPIIPLAQRVEMLEAESDAQPVVVDANGVQVGTPGIQDHWIEPWVAFDLEGIPLFGLQVERNRIVGSANTLFFESNDCSGQAFLRDDTTNNPSFVISFGESGLSE